MLSSRRSGVALALCVQLAAGCGDDSAPPPGSIGSGPSPQEDGGQGRGPRSPRPDGGAILPPADDQVELAFGAEPVRYPIAIDAAPSVLDVHLSVDTSSSIDAEIDALQGDLDSEIVPRLRERVVDVSFGVSRFEDFPGEPFGAPGGGDSGTPPDTPYRLLSPITSDAARVASAVAGLDQPLGYGGDVPESGAEALWQIATGAGYVVGSQRLIEVFDGPSAPGGGSAGGVGFREGALRVVLHVTDAPSHDPRDYGDRFPDTHDMAQAARALRGIDAKLLAVVCGACDGSDPHCEAGSLTSAHAAARAELELAALQTGAAAPAADDECPFGLEGASIPAVDGRCPLVFDAASDGSGLSDTLVDAIVELVDGVRFARVTGTASDDPLGFVQRVTPADSDSSDDGDAPELADLLPEGDPDGELDSFVEVRAMTRLRFEVELRNVRIAPSDVDQRFRIVVQVEGDGVILQRRTLRIVVPKGTGIVPPPAPDAGPGDDDGGA